MIKDWKTKYLEEIAEIGDGNHSGNYPKASEMVSKGVPFIRGTNLIDGKVSPNDMRFITSAKHEILKKGHLKTGDILFTNRGQVGKKAIVDLKFNGSNLNSQVAWFRCNEQINNRYLYYHLDSPSIQKFISENTNGTALQQLTIRQIRKIIISIPSLSEQQQIVAILDEAFTAIAQAKANVEKNIQNAKELYENWIQELFENPKDNWQKKKWGELCHFVRGPFGGSLKKSMFKEEGYVVYEQKHAIHNHFNQLRYFIDEEKFNEMKRFEVKPGDIIMSCSGVTLGRVAIIPDNIPRGIINQALLKLTPNKGVSVEFIKYWLRSNIFQTIIFEHAGGAAIPNVPSAKILKEIFIPFPNFEEQLVVVNKIKLMQEETNNIIDTYSRKRDDLQELKKSILQKAFAGELTYNSVEV